MPSGGPEVVRQLPPGFDCRSTDLRGLPDPAWSPRIGGVHVHDCSSEGPRGQNGTER